MCSFSVTATVQLAFVLASSTACPDVEHSAQYNWTWKLEFCASNKKRFTLEIVAQTLENCSSTCSSETTDYNQRKALDFCLRVGNGKQGKQHLKKTNFTLNGVCGLMRFKMQM